MSKIDNSINGAICGGGEVASRTMFFCKVSPRRAELRRSVSQYMLYFGLIITAAVIFKMEYVRRVLEDPNWHSVFTVFIIASFFLVGLIGLTTGFRLRKIIFSKDTMAIEIVPGLTGRREKISFDEIQSLQLLYHRFGEEDSCHCYEINLIFNDPERDRYNLTCYDDPKAAKNVIKELSIFMDKSYSLAGLYDYRLRD